MEIITIVLQGAVAHKDSTGGEGITRPGDLQVMSAGTGVIHSEYNPSGTAPLHLLQIWIMPNARGHTLRTFPAAARTNTLLRVVSSDGANGSLAIHEDAALSVADLDAGARLAHGLAPRRRASGS